MTIRRLSHLQKQILSWLWRDEQRTRGMISSSHPELVGALPAAKGNISHSLRLLEHEGGSSLAAPWVGKRNPCTSRGRDASRRSNWREVMNK
jgi:hypothetical protein